MWIHVTQFFCNQPTIFSGMILTIPSFSKNLSSSSSSYQIEVYFLFSHLFFVNSSGRCVPNVNLLSVDSLQILGDTLISSIWLFYVTFVAATGSKSCWHKHHWKHLKDWFATHQWQLGTFSSLTHMSSFAMCVHLNPWVICNQHQ